MPDETNDRDHPIERLIKNLKNMGFADDQLNREAAYEAYADFKDSLRLIYPQNYPKKESENGNQDSAFT